MNSLPIFDRIDNLLEQRRAGGRFRTTAPCRNPAPAIDCSTNSYLGLHVNAEVARMTDALTGGQTHGNLASRLVATVSQRYDELEQEIATWEQTETALVFTSGYAANLGILQALCTRSTEVFCDRLNHASIYDGIKLAGCKLNRYRHNDMADLRERLQTSAAREKLIVTDTVFSMDGDAAPLSDIAELARTHRAMVMVDEAHATGMFGKTGSGLVEATGTAAAIDIRMGTLSKAVAGLGGYAATTTRLRDYFVNFSRSQIYSTGLPHPVLARNLSAIRYIRSHPERGGTVLRNAAAFRISLEELGFSTRPSTTQIIPCYVKSDREATALAAHLGQYGIVAPAIRPPTVPAGTARVRFSWSALLNEEHLHSIVKTLQQWQCSYG